MVLLLLTPFSIISQHDHFDPVPVTKKAIKITEKIFPQYATSYFDKDVMDYKDGQPLKKDAYIDGYVDHSITYSYTHSDTMRSESALSSNGFYDKVIITHYKEYGDIDYVEIYSGPGELKLTGRQDAFFYNEEGKIFGYSYHSYKTILSDSLKRLDTITVKYYAEYDEKLRLNYVESVDEEVNSLLIENIYYNDKDNSVLITIEGVALDPQQEIDEGFLFTQNHFYKLNDEGDWIKSYNINHRGKKELLSKRRIKYEK